MALSNGSPMTMTQRYVSAKRAVDDSFPQPTDGSAKVWRYLDLEKLIALLDARRLFFARADTLGDEYEGSVTRGVHMRVSNNPALAEQMSRMRLQIKRQIFAS